MTRAASTPRVMRSGVGPARPARRRRGTEQRLDLDQERSSTLQHRHHHAAGNAGHAIAQQQRTGIGDGSKPVVAHLEDPHLTGRPEAVLHRREHAQRVVTIAVEGEDRVDQVLDGPRSRQVAVLGDVADQHDRHPGRLGQPGQPVHAVPDLGQAPRRPGELGVARWSGRSPPRPGQGGAPDDGGLDRADVVPRQDHEVLGYRPHARGPAADLGQGLLGRGQQTPRIHARPRRPAPGTAGSTCRRQGGRRPASPIRPRSLRPSPGRPRRSRSAMGSASPTDDLAEGDRVGVRPAAVAAVRGGRVAVNVFHSAQFGHRPAHCKAVQPQVVQ